MVVKFLDFASHHLGDDVILVGMLDVGGHHRMPVPEHGDSVGEPPHLLHAVGDVNQARALLPQHVHQREEVLRFGSGQRCRGFVEDEDPRVLRDGLGDFDHLLLTGAQITEECVRVDVRLDDIEFTYGVLPHALLVQQPRLLQRFVAECEVLRHRHGGHHIEFLMDDGDAEVVGLLRRGDVYLFAINENASGVPFQIARKDVHHRRFSGTVLTHEGKHLMFIKV